MTQSIKTDAMMQQFMLRLKNAAPETWDNLVQTFDIYATEVTVAVTQAPADCILVMQGRAQQCLALLRLMRECDRQNNSPAAPAQVNPAP
jgi:hypothetical protein